MFNKKNILKEEESWKKERDIQERKMKIRKEKYDLRNTYSIKPSTSKLLIAFLFLNCSLIEIFTCWTVYQSLIIAASTGLSPDFSPLTTLIGAVVSEVIGFAVYAIKSAKENTQGGIVFEKTMAELNKNPLLAGETAKEENVNDNGEACG